MHGVKDSQIWNTYIWTSLWDKFLFFLNVQIIWELDLVWLSISHDDSGFRSDWFLDKVIIDCPSLGKSWTFPCNRWLAKGKDDGKIERELFPQNLETEEYTPCKNWTYMLLDDLYNALLFLLSTFIEIYMYCHFSALSLYLFLVTLRYDNITCQCIFFQWSWNQ